MKYLTALCVSLLLFVAACGGDNSAPLSNSGGNEPAASDPAKFSFSGKDTDSPQNVVYAMETARRDQDKDRFIALMSKEDLETMKETDEPEPIPENSFEIGEAMIDGGSAKVKVIYTKPDGTSGPAMTWHCVKEGDEWKLAFKKTMMAMFKGED